MTRANNAVVWDDPRIRRRPLSSYVLLCGLLPAALAWSYWPTLQRLFEEWGTDHNYSSGALVLPAALYLLWHDRKALAACRVRPAWTWGAALLLIALAARTFGLLFHFKSAERYSLVLTIAAIVLLVGGVQVFRLCKWVLLFLLLLVPLPGRIHNLISDPLQGLATGGAVVMLELLGIPVVRQGNVIVLNPDVMLAVAEACSGLRMLTAFVMVAATLAYVVERPRWQKAVLLISSIPVAIVCNLARLVATALLCLVTSDEWAERFFHDFAGLVMMPLAILVLFGELWVLSKMVIEERDGPSSVGLRNVRRGNSRRRSI